MSKTHSLLKLKMPFKPLSPARYRTEVERAVAEFERRMKAPRKYKKANGQLRDIVRVLEQIGRPATYDEVAREMGVAPDDAMMRWQISSRLQGCLCRTGCVAKVGRVSRESPWPYGHHVAKRGRPAALYEFVSYTHKAHVESCVRRLERQMDLLDARRAIGSCVLSSWSFAGTTNAGSKTERNQGMIRQYLEGATLREIGRQWGVTRERVRQIIATAVNRRRACQQGLLSTWKSARQKESRGLVSPEIQSERGTPK